MRFENIENINGKFYVIHKENNDYYFANTLDSSTIYKYEGGPKDTYQIYSFLLSNNYNWCIVNINPKSYMMKLIKEAIYDYDKSAVPKL